MLKLPGTEPEAFISSLSLTSIIVKSVFLIVKNLSYPISLFAVEAIWMYLVCARPDKSEKCSKLC